MMKQLLPDAIDVTVPVTGFGMLLPICTILLTTFIIITLIITLEVIFSKF